MVQKKQDYKSLNLYLNIDTFTKIVLQKTNNTDRVLSIKYSPPGLKGGSEKLES